jgi:5-methylcytosine-specific restriction endonuclease McrA
MAKTYNVNMCIITEYRSLEVLKNFTENPGRAIIFTFSDKDYRVKQSISYKLFLNNASCAICGIIGTVLRLEYSRGNNELAPHFNLYAVKNDSLVLMTKDHIIPESIGGPTALWNLQTMCANCNHKKGNVLPDVLPAIPENEYENFRRTVCKKLMRKMDTNVAPENLFIMHFLLNPTIQRQFIYHQKKVKNFIPARFLKPEKTFVNKMNTFVKSIAVFLPKVTHSFSILGL